MEDLDHFIKLELRLPWEINLSFSVQILPYNNDLEGKENKLSSSNDLLGMVQDVFYVMHLLEIHEDKEDKRKELEAELNERDNYWDVFNWIWYQFVQILRDDFSQVTKRIDATLEEKNRLKIKGEYDINDIEKLGEPYITRYKLYKVMSLLQPQLHYNYGSLDDIVCSYHTFVNFFNSCIQLLSKIILRLQDDKVEEIKNIFKHIMDDKKQNQKCIKSINKYLTEGKDGKCFAITTVNCKNTTKEDLLCFSGTFFKADLLEVINKIVKALSDNPKFNNPKLIRVNDDIRYYIDGHKYITYGDAKQCGAFKNGEKNKYNRMFSCCERKIFADYNWSECKSYRMVVKYSPCRLCTYSVKKHKKKYNGNIISGKSNNQLNQLKLALYDSVANCIYDRVSHHKLKSRRFKDCPINL